jgi:hypothetical protein
MDPYGLSLTASSGTVSNAIFKIGKPMEAQYTLQSGASAVCNLKSQKPGTWRIMATVILSSGVSAQSNAVNVEVQYPDVDTIKNNSTVSSKMDDVWDETKTAASDTGQREKGFMIYVNTTSMSYECGTTIDGDILSCTTGSISITGNERIYSSPLSGGKYFVADFHTHPPLKYCPTNTVRPVGPSSTDISGISIPGLVYDYTGSYISSQEYTGITGGHDIDAAAQIYTYGPNRRATPN